MQIITILKDLIIGIALIVFGYYVINDMRKHPNKRFWSYNIKGYLVGIGFIILGIIYLLRKLHIVSW